MSYRPRGVLARAIYEKFHNDNYLNEYDTSLWYSLNKELPAMYQKRFVHFVEPDDTTKRWMELAKTRSGNIWLHLWHTLARSVMQFFMTQTDINGYLKRGSMFILSEEQFSCLLKSGGFNAAGYEEDPIHMLDIGAGDGEITLRLFGALSSLKSNQVKGKKVHVYATETSWTMRDRLRLRNFTVIERITDVQNVQLISCLNVLDRCYDPFELLQDIWDTLAPNGRAVIALVLPYTHYVEFNSSHMPSRPLMEHWPYREKHLSFEAEATIFFQLLESVGFRIEAWTKAPYLCEGDLHQSYYWLIDLVVVLSKKAKSM